MRKSMNNLRFLIIDDEGPIREMNKTVLTLKYPECVVHECTDGDEFLPRAREARDNGKPYHMYLVDNRMNRMNGLEALDILRREGDTIPAIMITGTGDLDIQPAHYRDLKPFYVLDKPYSIPKLRETINTVLQVSTALQSPQ